MKRRVAILITIVLLMTTQLSSVATGEIYISYGNNSITYTKQTTYDTELKDIFPRKYDLRQEGRLTPVKEQGGIGSCWAVASIAALESSLLTSEGKAYDFSENNMITQLSDIYDRGFDRKPEDGGDDALATSYYASWRGPVLESSDPYPQSKQAHDITVRTGLKPIKHVQEVVFLPERKDPLDNDLIKRHVTKYGAISASMWKGTPQTFGKFYNEEYFAWYYPYDYMNDEGNGHAVDIVGWDDDFPKENFSIKPPGDGAFIVRNTKGPLWGQQNRKENMGGYFYISYYDMMLGTKLDSNIGNSVITRIDDVNNYDHIYQYDILGFTESIKSNTKNNEAWFANVFKINKTENEQLAAVSFYTLEENLDYEIWIAKGFKDEDYLKKLTKIKGGNIELPGYHTIDLEKYIDLTKDEKIAVAVKLYSKSLKPSIAIESPTGIMSSKVTANGGESYYKGNNNRWNDITSNQKNTNVCLKIFTKDKDIPSDKLLSFENMKKDVDFLVDWISTHQPVAREDGYTKEQKEIIDFAYNSINEPKTENEFYLIINRLFTMMMDGHTKLYYYPKDTMYLNIPFDWLEEGMIVSTSIDNYLLGDRILSIGGKTEKELNEMLYSQVSAENDYWIRSEAPSFLTVDLYLRHYGLVNGDDTVDVEIERAGEKFVVREPLTHRRRVSNKEQRKWFSWHIEKENHLGYFRFDSWANGDKFEEIKRNLDVFFNQVAENQIDNIVFDIRENPGGTAQILNYLLSYLDTGKIYSHEYQEYTPGYQYPKVKEPLLFTGNTYFMLSNKSFSCSVFATTILKDNGIVKVIGEPSGEKPAFNRHGRGSDGSLPASGWKFMMSSYRPKRPLAFDESEVAIFPDIPVNTAREDLVSDRDIQMERMREISRATNWIYPDDKINTVESNRQLIIKKAKEIKVDNKNDIVYVDFDIKSISEEDIWIEDVVKHNKISVSISKEDDGIKLKVPDSVEIGKTYHLVIRNKDIDTYAILMTVMKKVSENSMKSSLLPGEVTYCTYASKYNYIVIGVTKDLAKKLSSSKVILKDEEEKKVSIKHFGRGSTVYHNLIISPRKALEGNKTYTLFIPTGTIKFENGEVCNEDINMTFTVK